MGRKVWIGLLLAAVMVLAEAQAQTEADSPQAEGVLEPTKAPQEKSASAPEENGEVKDQARKDAKVISGMSILGNQEAPKSLVIVPWKSSEIGGAMDISTMLDDSRQPVDMEVFLRALRYYEIRSETKP
jgi:hypothetical protein